MKLGTSYMVAVYRELSMSVLIIRISERTTNDPVYHPGHPKSFYISDITDLVPVLGALWTLHLVKVGIG